MMLVASISPFGVPLMLGDLLIIGEPSRRTMSALPTLGSFHFIDDGIVDLSQIAGLSQKICLINDRLVVGWAGAYEAAKRIISRMRAFPWTTHITLTDVQQCLATTDYEDRSAVSLVGVFSHDQGFGEFGLNAPKMHLHLFNQSRVIGSGKDNFMRMAQGIYDRNYSSDDQLWSKAVTVTLGSSGTLLGEELNTYGGLIDHFRGSFEILLYQNNKFRKLDNILYCFWEVASHSKHALTISPHAVFIKLAYFGDILVIRRSDFSDPKNMINEEFIVGPMAKKVTEDQLRAVKTIDLNSEHNCHYVVVHNGDLLPGGSLG